MSSGADTEPERCNATPCQYELAAVAERPVFSIAPFSTRMVSAYEDRKGDFHIVADVLDHCRKPPIRGEKGAPFPPTASWDGRLAYYCSKDLQYFTYQHVVAGRGKWTGTPETSDTDSVGVASPGILPVNNGMWVYYASRGPRSPKGPFYIRTAKPEDPGALPGRIEAACASADANGSPTGPFEKQGVVIDLAPGHRSIRLDDPCALIHDNRIWLFFKAIGGENQGGDRVIMVAYSSLDNPEGPFTVEPQPVLIVQGGAEMPRVFHDGRHWHMFVRRFVPNNLIWEHYAAEVPTDWFLMNDAFFGGAGPNPGKGVTDICPVWRPFSPGGSPRFCLAAGMDDGTYGDAGIIKQWAYRITPCHASTE